MNKSKVYFSKNISPENVLNMYKVLGRNLIGNIAVKVHSGEKGNQNFLGPEFMKPVIEHVNGTVVECNTAYAGARHTTEKHLQLMKEHGWSENFKVDIMDAEGPDVAFDIKNGNVITKNYVGKNLLNYDGLLVVSHFKGHQMGGFGGAIKQLSIGIASTAGKCYIHSAGATTSMSDVWKKTADQKVFLEAMAESAGSVLDHFKQKTAFVTIMKNISVDCDCNAHAKAPCMKDIGILSSLDPVALDKACIDLAYSANDKGKTELIERVESRFGQHTLECAEKLGLGSRDYELIVVD